MLAFRTITYLTIISLKKKKKKNQPLNSLLDPVFKCEHHIRYCVNQHNHLTMIFSQVFFICWYPLCNKGTNICCEQRIFMVSYLAQQKVEIHSHTPRNIWCSEHLCYTQQNVQHHIKSYDATDMMRSHRQSPLSSMLSVFGWYSCIRSIKAPLQFCFVFSII